jgi:hypothetical protein
MKYDKSNLPRLDDKISHQYFRSNSAPNGTADLIIADRDNQVIGVISEALFPPNTNFNKWNLFICDGDSVMGLDPLANNFEEFTESEDLLEALNRDQVLEWIAISPVQSAKSVLKQINKIVRGVK